MAGGNLSFPPCLSYAYLFDSAVALIMSTETCAHVEFFLCFVPAWAHLASVFAAMFLFYCSEATADKK